MKPARARSAIITGANRGLGQAIAAALRRATGRDVLLTRARRDLLADGRRASWRRPRAEPGQHVVWHRRRRRGPEPTVERRRRARSSSSAGVDVLVNNAGVYGPMGRIEDVDWDEWVAGHRDQPVRHGADVPRRHARSCARQGYGKIINLSGGGATAPLPRISAYAASKAAVVRLTETLAEELQDAGIDVNADRAGRAEHAPARRGARGRAGEGRPGFYERSLKQQRRGRHAAREGRGAGGVPRVAGERRHHRPAAQRRLGRLGDAARAARAAGRERRLHAPPDRRRRTAGWTGTTCSVAHRRLRADRAKRAQALGRRTALVGRARTSTLDRAERAGRASTPGCARDATDWRDVVERATTSTLVVVATTNDVARAGHARGGRGRQARPRREAGRPQRRPSSSRSPTRRASATRASSSRSASTTASTRRLRKARELFDAGALGAADVRPRPLRPRRAARATRRSGAADPRDRRRRRDARPGRPPDRPGALVPRRLRRRRGPRRHVLLGLPVEDNGFACS